MEWRERENRAENIITYIGSTLLRRVTAQTKVVMCTERQGYLSVFITEEQTAEKLHQMTRISLLDCIPLPAFERQLISDCRQQTKNT